MSGNAMLLSVDELTIQTETLSALKSAGIKKIGDLESKEHLLGKGISEKHATQVCNAMHNLGLWLVKPSCET